MECEVEARRPIGHGDYLDLWSADGCHQNPFDDATRMVHLLSRPLMKSDEVKEVFEELLRLLGRSHNSALRWEMTHVIHRTSVRRSMVFPAAFMANYLRIASADHYDHVFAGFERSLCDQLERGNWRFLTAMIRRSVGDLQARYESFGGKERLVATRERLATLNKELSAQLKLIAARVRKEIAELEERKANITSLLESPTLSEGGRENFQAEVLEIDDDINDRKKDIAEEFPRHCSSLRKTITELAGVVKRLSTLELQINRHEALLTKYASS